MTSNFLTMCVYNDVKKYCEVDIALAVLIVLELLMCLYAFIRMFLFYRSVKFEDLVILGSIVECIFLFLSKLTYLEILAQFDTLIHIVINLYISRRLLRILIDGFYTIDKPKNKFKVYDVYFFSLTIVSLILMILISIGSKFKTLLKISEIFFGFFILCINISFFCLGCKIVEKFKKASKEIDKEEVGKYIADNQSASKDENKDLPLINQFNQEEYYSTRRAQMYNIIIVHLICSIYIFMFTIAKHSFSKNDYRITKFKFIPETTRGFIFIAIDYFLTILSILSNLVSFYFMISGQYVKHYSSDIYIHASLRSSEDGYANLKYTKENKNIDNFIKEKPSNYSDIDVTSNFY